MRRLGRTLLLLSLLMAAQLGPLARAQADDAEPQRNLSLQAAFGYGLQDDEDAGSYGTALGLKAGYTLIGWLHLGAQGTFHLGSQFGDELNRVAYYGLEAGGRIHVSRLSVTPYLTGGIAHVSSQRNRVSSLTAGYLGLGTGFDVVTYEALLLGADLRFVMIPGGSEQSDNVGPSSTVEFLLTAGVRL